MLRKILSTFVAFVLFGAAGQVFADAAAELEHAESYRQNRQYPEAEQAYNDIISQYPGTEETFQAQKNLTILYIAWDKQPEAEAASQELLADHSDRPDIADAVIEIVDKYSTLNKHEKAEELFQHILDNWSQSEPAIWAQAGLAMSNAALGEMQAADAVVETLLTEFSDSPQIGLAIHDIAYEFLDLGRYERAGELFQYVLDSWPDSTMAMWSQEGLVGANIALADDPNTQAAFDTLMADFSDDPDLPDALYSIAQEYEDIEIGNYQKAKQIYEQIIQQYPDSSAAAKARFGIQRCQVLLDIAAGDDAAAQAAIDKLFTEFSGHTNLAKQVLQIAEQYYNKTVQSGKKELDSEARNYLQKATTICEKIMQQVPISATIPGVYDLAADSYRQLGRYGKAIECYREVVSIWPDYEHAWNAQFQIGYCSQQLKDTGVIPKSLADSVTKAAYEQVLEKYPKCPAARAAKSWLDYHLK